MTSLIRSRGVVALLVGSAFLLALTNGCGSSSGKKTTRPTGDAGAAGETSSAGAAGEPTSAGAPPVGSAGQGGEAGSGEGGSAGVESEAGAAGAIPVDACIPSGQVSDLKTSTEAIYQACRGAVLHVPFDFSEASPQLRCCGVSNVEPTWGAALDGTTMEGVGELQLQVPNDAPYGSQSLALTCASEGRQAAIAIEVNDGATPIVDEISPTVNPNGQMVIKGAHLTGVTQVYAMKPAGTWPCSIDAESTDSMLFCTFDGIPLSGSETDFYRLFVASDVCGFAEDSYLFGVTPPTG